MKTKKKGLYTQAFICLAIVIGLFTYMGVKMGAANMLNTIMHTAHDLLLTPSST